MNHNPPFPVALAQLHELEFDYADGAGIDFEPYDEFLSPEEASEWLHAWTGNDAANGSPYLVFGQDGAGGYATIWKVCAGDDLLAQPIVFFGSEGELGVIAQNFSDYLWLLAGGHGPLEAVSYPSDSRAANPAFTEFAKAHATTPAAKPSEILARAQAEFPDFERNIRALCG